MNSFSFRSDPEAVAAMRDALGPGLAIGVFARKHGLDAAELAKGNRVYLDPSYARFNLYNDGRTNP